MGPHWSPRSRESHCEKLRALAAPFNLHQPAVAVLTVARRNALEMMVLRVFLPMWIILVPVSACWQLFVSATE